MNEKRTQREIDLDLSEKERRDLGTFLDTEGFEAWAANSGGRPHRTEKHEIDVRKDADGRFLGREVDLVTLKQEREVLFQFGRILIENDWKSYDQSAIQEGMRIFKERLESRRPKNAKDPDRRLSPVTVERYLTVVRRYARYRKVPPGARLQSGPSIPRPLRSIIGVDLFNAWMDSLPADDSRLAIITWLAISQMELGLLEDLVYGDHVTVHGSKVDVKIAGFILNPTEPLRALLIEGFRAEGGEGPVFRSRARFHSGGNPQMTLAGIRSLWTGQRRRLNPEGPTMREMSALGRRVNLHRRDNRWVYEYKP